MKKVSEPIVSITVNKPENLVLEDLIKPDRPYFVPVRRDDGTSSHKITTGKQILKNIPAMYFFIHVLLERQHSDVDVLRCWFAKDFVEMFSRDIEPLKSKNYFRFIWGILRTIGVIDYHDDTRPNKYRKSAKAYYFKFIDKYCDAVIVQHQIQVKKTIADKLNKKWNKSSYGIEEIDISSISNNKQLAHQYNALRSMNFDSQPALNLAKKLLNDGVINNKQYNSFLTSINNIINGRIKTTHSSSCNRFFTPVTRMPKELRQFIKDAEGNSLVELDFSSFNAYAVYKIINTITPEYDFDIDKMAFENELDLYRRILTKGDFYRDFKLMFFFEEELNRDQIKDIVLKRWFNGRINSRNKYRKFMLKRLPRISEIIDSLKSVKYENFSNTAMQMESELVNDIIYKKFIEIHPDAIMYTIFDSFLVEQKYASLLQTMMTEEGSKYFDALCFVRAKRTES